MFSGGRYALQRMKERNLTLKKEYPFPGEVTLSTDEYADLILDLNKAQRDAQLYLDAFKSVQKRYEELVKSAEDNF